MLLDLLSASQIMHFFAMENITSFAFMDWDVAITRNENVCSFIKIVTFYLYFKNDIHSSTGLSPFIPLSSFCYPGPES